MNNYCDIGKYGGSVFGSLGLFTAQDSLTTPQGINLPESIVKALSSPYASGVDITDAWNAADREERQRWQEGGLHVETDRSGSRVIGTRSSWIGPELLKSKVTGSPTRFLLSDKEFEKRPAESTPEVLQDDTGLFIRMNEGLTSDAKKKINDAILLTSKRSGMLPKIVDLGLIKDIFNDAIVKLLPKAALDVHVYLASSINGKRLSGFASGIKDGVPIIVMHPEQAANDYVRGILHEVKHVSDILSGKEVTATEEIASKDYQSYRRLPSERRAEDFEKRILKKLQKNSSSACDALKKKLFTANVVKNKSSIGSLVFTEELIGSHNRQSDIRLTALLHGKSVGYIEYSIFDEEVYVQYIYVDENYRRRGIGRALLLKLQNKYPDIEMELGFSTPDGESLVNSLGSEFFPNEKWEKLLKEKKALLAKKDLLDKKVNNWLSLTKEEQDLTRSKFLSKIDEFDDISDRLYEIEQEMRNLKPGKTIFNLNN